MNWAARLVGSWAVPLDADLAALSVAHLAGPLVDESAGQTVVQLDVLLAVRLVLTMAAHLVAQLVLTLAAQLVAQ